MACWFGGKIRYMCLKECWDLNLFRRAIINHLKNIIIERPRAKKWTNAFIDQTWDLTLRSLWKCAQSAKWTNQVIIRRQTSSDPYQFQICLLKALRWISWFLSIKVCGPQKYNAISVIVDRLSKVAYFVPKKTNVDAMRTIILFLDK